MQIMKEASQHGGAVKRSAENSNSKLFRLCLVDHGNTEGGQEERGRGRALPPLYTYPQDIDSQASSEVVTCPVNNTGPNNKLLLQPHLDP